MLEPRTWSGALRIWCRSGAGDIVSILQRPRSNGGAAGSGLGPRQGRKTRAGSESFDFIIVGAGSAGCVLADRLTASGRHRVLLLEAGPGNLHPWLHIPLGFGRLFSDRRYNWCYETIPQPECHNRNVIAPRGKVLGGSSSINGLIYIRGQAEDFDYWRQLGNAGWSFADVLPYFRKAENNERGADEFHGAGGPLGVSDLRDRHPLAVAYVEAAVQCGYPRNDDFNGAGAGRRGLLPDHHAATACAPRPRTAISRRRGGAPISRWCPRRSPRVFCLMAGAPPASSILSATTNAVRVPMSR